MTANHLAEMSGGLPAEKELPLADWLHDQSILLGGICVILWSLAISAFFLPALTKQRLLLWQQPQQAIGRTLTFLLWVPCAIIALLLALLASVMNIIGWVIYRIMHLSLFTYTSEVRKTYRKALLDAELKAEWRDEF